MHPESSEMAFERKFQEQYSLQLSRLKPGKQKESFELDRSFFEHFDFGLSKNGTVKADLEIHKYSGHLDVLFRLTGTVEVECDRCLELYPQPIDSTQRLIYSFNPDQKFDKSEVIQVQDDTAPLLISQELYDYTQIALPLRRVPDRSLHICNPDVLSVLGMDPDGNPLEFTAEPDDDDIDPRWAALKKLKDQQTD